MLCMLIHTLLVQAFRLRHPHDHLYVGLVGSYPTWTGIDGSNEYEIERISPTDSIVSKIKKDIGVADILPASGGSMSAAELIRKLTNGSSTASPDILSTSMSTNYVYIHVKDMPNHVWDIEGNIRNLIFYPKHGGLNQVFAIQRSGRGVRILSSNGECLAYNGKDRFVREACDRSKDTQLFIVEDDSTNDLGMGADIDDTAETINQRLNRMFRGLSINDKRIAIRYVVDMRGTHVGDLCDLSNMQSYGF